MSQEFEQYVVMRRGVMDWGRGSVRDTPTEFRVESGGRTLRVPKHVYAAKAALQEELSKELRSANFEVGVLQGEFVASRHVRKGVEERLLDAMARARAAEEKLREVSAKEGPFLIVRRGKIAEEEIAHREEGSHGSHGSHGSRGSQQKTSSTALKDRLREAVRAGLGRKFLFTTYEQCTALRKPTSMTRPEMVAVIREHYPDLLKHMPKPLSKMTKADLCALVMSAAA